MDEAANTGARPGLRATPTARATPIVEEVVNGPDMTLASPGRLISKEFGSINHRVATAGDGEPTNSERRAARRRADQSPRERGFVK